MRELYGYYNTETGSSLMGDQPLSSQERRQLDEEIDQSLDATLEMLEKFAAMKPDEYMSYLSQSLSGLGALFGGSGGSSLSA